VQALTHPIKPVMHTVFLPVTDLKASIEWYANLFEQPIRPNKTGGGIYWGVSFDGTGIILDSNMWGFPPMIMFESVRDIDASYDYCNRMGYMHIGELYRYSEASHFTVGGNMVCWAVSHEQPQEPVGDAHPLLRRISRVIAHADHAAETESWYAGFLRKDVRPDPVVQGLNGIAMEKGADLLVDDNRLSQTGKVHYEKLQLDLRVAPALVIDSPDVEAARAHVSAKHASNVTGIEERLGAACFTFYDPYGNGIMVRQTP